MRAPVATRETVIGSSGRTFSVVKLLKLMIASPFLMKALDVYFCVRLIKLYRRPPGCRPQDICVRSGPQVPHGTYRPKGKARTT